MFEAGRNGSTLSGPRCVLDVKLLSVGAGVSMRLRVVRIPARWFH